MNRDVLARLAVAPELVLLGLAEHTLDAMLLALAVEHPSIADPGVPSTTPTLRRARALDRAARRLRHAIKAYSGAVDAVTSRQVVDPDDDELPF
jgi:hypothetical protein